MVRRCAENGWKRVAFVGTAKHAGKTTALGAFLAQAEAAGARVGLCSIGLDGERLDTILGVPKPAVIAPEGSIVASAERALLDSEAQVEWLEALPIHSPLGTVMLARVIRRGAVLLAGVRQRRHVQDVIPALLRHGVDFCLVDGAFDRVASAAPHLVDAAVVAVGAISGQTVQEVAAHAHPFLARFQFEEVEESVRVLLHEAHESTQICVVRMNESQVNESLRPHEASAAESYSMALLPATLGASGLNTDLSILSQADIVYFPGAVTDTILTVLASQQQPLTVVARHPAQIFAGMKVLERFFRAGHKIRVWKQLPLAGVAVNPHNISGWDLPRSELTSAISALVPGVPVYDAKASALEVESP